SGDLYARVPVGDHHETLAINEQGSGFRRWLTWRYNRDTNGTPSATAMTQAMNLFASKAEFEGDVQRVYTRIANTDDNNTLYLDLGNDQWQVVKISQDDWDVTTDYPVHFRRPNGIEPLPVPEHGGSLDELREFINIATEDDWKMLVAWLLSVFHPTGPYPILAISGERGAAKTNATWYLRKLVDPNSAPLRTAPKDISDLVIAAKNGRVLALDNLSGMPEWLSDALCRMATGSGYATRALDTNDQEALFNDCKPFVFNGIEELTSRGDLSDGCLAICLQPIGERERKTERVMKALWAKKAPRILGALLDAVVAALAERHTVKLSKLPRMADLAEWVCAAEKHLGWKRGSFIEAFDLNRENAVQMEVDS